MHVRADEIVVGDVLKKAVGRCRVVALYTHRGGIEAVVEAADSESSEPGTRVLWWWPQQGVNRVRASGSPKVRLQERPRNPPPKRGAAG